ncbi:NAD(P)H-dependent glycerol-3-phosphate dehydrogenase [Silvibacterium acidisoli]|uniref:NAD(P)H-dependent glycerol-3-phosphate dehydrogenase n=1 Tax=Acidobacteriaceae bacterium ZG23-2 TaxID=2883246 RepID=UPI00406BE680
MSRIAVMGAGAWGTALALSIDRRGDHQVTLWSHTDAVADGIARNRINSAYLPGIPIPESIAVTSDIPAALSEADVLLSVMPSHHVRESYSLFAPHLREGQILVSATKGVEDQTYLRMSEVIGDTLARFGKRLPLAVLSGPSFAQEVAVGAPTALTVASAGHDVAARIQNDFGSSSLRVYTNEDVIGVELGGALKNVIAIASGIVSGLELGHNSTAALITRGIAEVTRLAVACGGRRETLSGLAGLGDLVLTCTGGLSRNRWVGIELGRGKTLPEILAGLNGKVAEGVRTTFAALGLAEQYGVELPIASQMAAILNGERLPVQAIQELMRRPGRDE